MARTRRRRARIQRGPLPSDEERDVWRRQRLNLRARFAAVCDSAASMAERTALRSEAIALGREAETLMRERLG